MKNARRIISILLSLLLMLSTAAVYCGGIPIGMTPPLYWTDFHQILLSAVQVLHHMIMPPLVLVLFLLNPDYGRIDMKKIPLVGIYPFVYSVLSIIRGAVSEPEFYVYPFYRPDFFWNIFFKGKELNLPMAYLLIFPILLCGIGVFLLLAFILALVNNRLCCGKEQSDA